MANKKWVKALTAIVTVGYSIWKSSNAKTTNTKPSDPKNSSSSKNTSKAKPTQSTPDKSAPSPASVSKTSTRSTTSRSTSKTSSNGGSPKLSSVYPGDFTGKVKPQYSPELDGDADPGEIVWTWVPYEDDHTQGKDRPILLIGYDGDWMLGLMLTSKDKDGARYGSWLDIGAGPWDNKGRDSEIRLDRVIRIDPREMRREGAIMDKTTFTKVIRAMK